MHDDRSMLKKLIWLRGRGASGGLPDGYRQVVGYTYSGNTYYKIDGLYLTGHDTVKFSLSITASCNVFGCYTKTTASDNYSLYVSTSSGAKYLRYNGGTYKSYWSQEAVGERFNITITPTGSHGMPADQDDTWDEVNFTTSVEMCIGTTATNATSAKLKGNIYGAFEVVGKFYGIPCERVSDGVLGYYDKKSGTFFEPIGSAPVSLGYA